VRDRERSAVHALAATRRVRTVILTPERHEELQRQARQIVAEDEEDRSMHWLRRLLARCHLRRARAHAEALIGLPWDGGDSALLDEVVVLEEQLLDKAQS
jgi:hypothetical protein